MSVVTWDISVTKRQQNHTHDNHKTVDINLYDYLKIAERCIGAFTSGALAHNMLRNEDAISFVAEHLMYAAYRWKEDGGRTFHSYLNMCAIRSIQRWILINKRARKVQIASLNHQQSESDGRQEQLYEHIADSKVTVPLQEMCEAEDMTQICQVMDTELTPRQRQCIELVYIEGLSGAEAARQLDISRQAVDQLLKQGIARIKVCIDK